MRYTKLEEEQMKEMDNISLSYNERLVRIEEQDKEIERLRKLLEKTLPWCIMKALREEIKQALKEE